MIKSAVRAGMPTCQNAVPGGHSVCPSCGRAAQDSRAPTRSNGQLEGQVNRLKLIKRQMYGRAKFGLLRARVRHSA
jgi:hypothetical protein